jgi:hypothetical protein
MKKSFLFIIAFIFSISIAVAQYENADAVFEKITKEYTLNQDGTLEFHYFKQLKLQSFLSFNRLYGETFIIYNPDFQNLKINESYTIMADSTKVEAPGNAFNEVLPYFAAHSSHFNNLREMVVTHTATEIGATLFLDYTIITQKDYWPALMGNEVIIESSPVKEMEIIVNVPVATELNHKMFGLRLEPEVMVQNNMKVYTWKFAGLAASSKEANMGIYQPGTPRLVFSTSENMENAIQWITNQDAFKAPLTAEMKDFAVKTKAEKSDEIAVLMALQEYVTKNMAFNNVPLEYSAFRVRTPEEIWKSNGGTELEKAVLLAGLLNAADIRAVPVLAGPKNFYDKKVGSLLLFDHVYVLASTKNEGDIYLSVNRADSQSLEFQMDGNIIIPLNQERSINPKEFGKADNRIFVKADFVADNLEAISGEMNLELYFASNPFLALANNEKSISKQLSGGLSLGDSVIVKIVNSNPAKSALSMKLLKKNPFKDISGYYRWELPSLKNGFESWHIVFLDTEHSSILELPFSLTEEYEFTVKIPQGYTFVNLKSKTEFKNIAGSVKTEFIPKGNTITVLRKLEVPERQISPASYADFRVLINAWLDQNQRIIVFKKQ